MRYAILVLTLAAATVLAAARPPQKTPKRNVPCKTAENASMCYWTRGRVRVGAGTPAYRLWKVGTNRLLGIYSGPGVDRYSLDNEDPEFPANVQRVWQTRIGHSLFADFEVCPLEPERPGFMQAACIEAARNVFVENPR